MDTCYTASLKKLTHNSAFELIPFWIVRITPKLGYIRNSKLKPNNYR
ncbi:hypothetical protein [Liquorilactobacillus uvarum]|nr:hypothetical protein [Liquorilactobacillus uvarum]